MNISKQFNGHSITFEFEDGNKMVNATQMAKPFGKRVDNYLRLQGTKDYILLLEARYSDVREREVLRIIQGGVPELQGTWMDEKLALKFAAWLSPVFELWVYDKIEELFRTGRTELDNRPSTDIISALRLIVDKLEYQERDINELKEGLKEVKDYVGDLEAKIISKDENYYSVAGYSRLVNRACPLHVAKELGRQATALSYQKGLPIGSTHDERYGKVGTYHKDVLKEVI